MACHRMRGGGLPDLGGVLDQKQHATFMIMANLHTCLRVL